MVNTLGPNCCSICRLYWSMTAALKLGLSVLKESGLRFCRFETLGAVCRGALAIANAVAATEKVGFDLNRNRRLAVRLKVREERNVLQIGVGGVVPGKVADPETAADDRPRRCRVGKAEAWRHVGVVG